MSGPMRYSGYLRSTQARNLAYMLGELLDSHEYREWNPANQQKAFNHAMEVLHRPIANANQEILVRRTLRKLAGNYGRTWTTHPPSSYFNMNNYMSNANRNSNRNNSSASNTNNNRSPRRNLPATPQMNGPAKNVGLRWRNIIRRGPAERVVPLNKNGVPRPKNGNTPVNIGGFSRNSYGIEYSKSKIDKNGTKKVLRFYYTIPTFERLVKKKWSNIRNKQSTYEVSNGIPGYPKPRQGEKPMLIRRRNLSLVRFK